ncbi:MAG: methyltransferase domain-containing protein [Planctomycetota bacterium]|nr:methyltransferase domain-containing protein [Planctomycetota bacterium]
MTHKDRARRMFRDGGSCRAAGGAGDLPGYSAAELASVPAGAAKAARGCSNPIALTALHPGQTVLDMGCGTGLDVFLAARAVGPAGQVIGVDTDAAALDQARAFAAEGGFANVEFRVGAMEKLPVDDGAVDVVISNCAVNYAPDKLAAFGQAYRVLKEGGRLAVSDLVLKGSLPDPHAPGLEVWASWLDVAAFKHDYLGAILAAGFKRVIVVAEAPYAGGAMTAALSGRIVGLHAQAKR